MGSLPVFSQTNGEPRCLVVEHMKDWLVKLTVGLRLPDGFTETPESRQNEENRQQMSVWDPDEQKNDEGRVQNAANGDERFTMHVTLSTANQTRADGIGHAQCYHAVTDVLNADCTADVWLQQTAQVG